VLPLSQARANGLGKFAKVAFIRVSNVAIERDSLVNRVDKESSIFVGSDPGNFADANGYAWHCRCEAGSQSRRSFFTLGGPDKWFVRNGTGQFIPDASMVTFLQTYLAALMAKGARLRVLDRTTLNPPIRVDLVTNVAGYVALRIKQPVEQPFVAGDFIQLYNFRGFRPSLTGRVQVTGLTTDTDDRTTLKTSRPYNILTEGTILNAYIRHVNFLYPLVTALDPINPATRRVGRAFFLPVGRRRKGAK